MKIPIALQLYTLREETEKDFLGTLEKVAKMGYEGVEFAGYGGLTATKIKSELDRLNLKAAGTHVGIDRLENNLKKEIEFCHAIGCKYIVFPWSTYENKKDFEDIALFLRKIGEECKKNDLTLCYHNHAHEFKKIEGQYGLDIIYEQVELDYLKAEIDTYWVKYAGIDPIEYMKKYADRIPLIHIKDMDMDTREFTEIGRGTMNIDAIIKFAMENGTQWLIVEQDICKRSPLESVKISIDNLKNK